MLQSIWILAWINPGLLCRHFDGLTLDEKFKLIRIERVCNQAAVELVLVALQRLQVDQGYWFGAAEAGHAYQPADGRFVNFFERRFVLRLVSGEIDVRQGIIYHERVFVHERVGPQRVRWSREKVTSA